LASLQTRTVFWIVRGPWTARTRSIALFACRSSASELARNCVALGRPAKKGGATVGREARRAGAAGAPERPGRDGAAARGADAAARDAPRAPSIVACAEATPPRPSLGQARSTPSARIMLGRKRTGRNLEGTGPPLKGWLSGIDGVISKSYSPASDRSDAPRRAGCSSRAEP